MRTRYLNPFRPTAGAEPPVLIGRDDVLDDFYEGLISGPGAPARLMRISGSRGSGKTVLLTELGDMARENGWFVVDETAGPELIPSIIDAVRHRSAVSGASVGVHAGPLSANVDLNMVDDHASLRKVLDAAICERARSGGGVLVTIDEIQDAAEEDVREIATAVQHLIREKKDIAFVFAGITTGVMDLLNGCAMTFLRRAKPEELGPIPIDDVALAFRESIERGGLEIGEEAVEHAARATAGYAYLVQLIGFYIWRVGVRHIDASTTITVEDVDRGIARATRAFESTVLETAISDLPKRAMEYLMAMSEDDAASSTAEIAQRLGVTAGSLSGVRNLLISKQIVDATARGYVGFSIPFLRDYLRVNRSSILARYGVVA